MARLFAFSIVTPSFGQLDWLELCLASVADQAVEGGVEHIVCDAGSPGIDEFMQRMEQRFPPQDGHRVRFVVGPDGGMYDAINKGLRLAEGGILSYLNCDEQLLPGALGAAGEFLAAHPGVDVVFGDAILVDATGEALCYWRPYVPTAAHLAGATLNTLSCSTFFRRRILEDGHFFDPQWKAVGDLVWVRGLLEARRPMACLPRPLAAFTFFGDNLGASRRAEEEFHATRRGQGGGASRLLHGMRKFLSGAYVRRRVTYDLFALSDPLRRRRYTHERLGWKWPRRPTHPQ